MQRLKVILQSERGSLPVYIFIVILITLLVAGVATEYLRINAVRDHIDYELSKAASVAIQIAVHDSHRGDKDNRLDEELAINTFYDYLYNEMQLDNSLKRYMDGKLVYKVAIDSIIFDEQTSRGDIKGSVWVPSAFFEKLVSSQMEIPFEIITPRNVRID